MTHMLPLAVFVSFVAMASADLAIFVNVRNSCPTADVVYVKGKATPVCSSMSAMDTARKTCWRMKGLKKYECYIPACYQSNSVAKPVDEEGTLVGPCAFSQEAVDAHDTTTPTKKTAARGSGTSLVPDTSVTNSFSARFLTNLPNNQGLREGWPDIPNSAFLHFPKSLVGRLGQIPNVYIDNTFEIRFACTSGGADDKCDLFAFIYRCPPCTFSNGGDFTSKLLADGWEPYSCDVKFQLDQTVPTHEHSTLVYHRQMDKHGLREANKWYTIKADSLLELSWYATSEATAHCESYDGDEFKCETELPDECQWDASQATCNRVLCPMKFQQGGHPPGPNGKPRPPQGPWGEKCKVCIDDERDMYMPELK
eukprot:TRINITY_DN183_c0_g1_i10.p1 TRINITY_DN183_c0_g1~~TRINITY_DN183_c0_g1_i10.p1  ORF type:complete len:367 (+),score=124.00 TRINITY_DN183_c0_g1_i10:67-1167(+)